LKLEKLLSGFERVIVSIQANEFPMSFPAKFEIKEGKVRVEKPGWLDVKIPAKACMLFHRHNEFVKKIRSVTLYGLLMQMGDILEFEPSKCYRFKQGGLNTLRFIISGKKRARKFLKKLAQSSKS
jgi:hypothetical protein